MDPIDSLLHSPAAKQWAPVGIKQHHGINLPLFSLRTKQSCGIGEYPDLLPLIPWCKGLGFDVIQLLPLNDCGPDTSPYSALSAIALNPMLLGLSQLPHLDHMPQAGEKLQQLRSFNLSQRIDYPGLYKAREAFLADYMQHAGPLVSSSSDYPLFLSQHPWLQEYALFKAIKIERQWQLWEDWPAELQQGVTPELLQRYSPAISFHCMIQYLCYKQMQEVKQTAEKSGLFLKGDIPILINRESHDVWNHRPLFLLEYEAGAPPDMYAQEGQKWGFPIYNWEEMERSQYAWWKERLDAASHLYHLYRLDHIVGFFRIWAIPRDKPAKEGFFLPQDQGTWIAHGEKILLMMLQNCSMLPIGEDLGIIPLEVRACLAKLGICGTKVIRWERYWDGDKSFIPYANYPAVSMTTVSTHDSETLQLWWSAHPDEALEFARFKKWDFLPSLTLDWRRQILTDSHHTASLFHINLLNEYLALIPGMVWPKPEDERINIPGLVLDTNWTYRFRPTVEEIIASEPLALEMKRMLII